MVELRMGSQEAELVYVCGKLPTDGYRVNRLTGEVSVLIPESTLEDLLGMKQVCDSVLDAA
ncbi:hypothetical protein AB0B15_03055 [Streptomyces sp. NPDC045456]|uniref:hypothetical protein n=1 Tax=Streptomyces sp. NPDC045456 TaxID=3155254 RepID=UPI0033F498F3